MSFKRKCLAVVVVLIFAIAVLNIVFEIGRTDNPSISMRPTLYDNQFYLTTKYANVSRYSLVIALRPDLDEMLVLKRIVGLPGETLEIKGGIVFVDGVELQEPYIKDMAQRGVENFILRSGVSHFTVPNDSYFLMGDNRTNSYDSRNFGPVPKNNIQGRVICVFWPLSSFKIF